MWDVSKVENLIMLRRRVPTGKHGPCSNMK